MATALGGGFIALTIDVWETNALVGLDLAAHEVRRAPPVDRLLADGSPLGFDSGLRPQEVVHLGSRMVVILAALALALLAFAWRDRIGALVAIAGPGVTGFLTEYVLKPLVNVPAPVGARAFPSGHAGGITAIALVAVIVVCRRWGWLPALVLVPLGAISVFLTGAALLRLDFHYPTDVLGGVLLASTVVVGLTASLSFYRGAGHGLLTGVRPDPADAIRPASAPRKGRAD